jgi:phosphinothricin acetyltransferase
MEQVYAMSDCEILTMTAEHWTAVRGIYAQGIATGNATFAQNAPDWAEWDAQHLPCCRLVAVVDGAVAGWAALSAVSSRHVYRGVAEVSVYIAELARGRGIGLRLLEALTAASEASGIWTLQAGILAENSVSIRLHERAGFRVVGRREKIGALNGVWRDTVLMERRSAVVGVAESVR